MTSVNRSNEKHFEPLLQGEYATILDLDETTMHNAALTVADVAHDIDDCRELLGMLGLLRTQEEDDV